MSCVATLFLRIKNLVWSLTEPRKILVPVPTPTLLSNMLAGRRALITGGTTGIGLSIAQAFLRAQAEVIITGRNQERIDKALKTLDSGLAHGLQLDNTNVASFPNKLAYCCKEFGTPDILVNNAGIIQCENFGATTLTDYDSIMHTNLRGAYFLSQEISKIWRQANAKTNILNIASSSSLRPGNSPYVLSKWGIRTLTLGLAKQLIKDNVVVNGIAPGPTDTELLTGNGSQGIAAKSIPAGRLVTRDEVANLAAILVSDMGRMVVGDILYITGGAGVVTFDDI